MTQNIFQEFRFNLLVFCKKKLVLLIILLRLDQILRFFCVVIYKCLADIYIHTHRRALLSCWTTLIQNWISFVLKLSVLIFLNKGQTTFNDAIKC